MATDVIAALHSEDLDKRMATAQQILDAPYTYAALPTYDAIWECVMAIAEDETEYMALRALCGFAASHLSAASWAMQQPWYGNGR